ncbi:MAG: hypothetical protein WCO23_02690 [bacterium]
MNFNSNKIWRKRFWDWAITILISKGAFYITLASIFIDIILIFVHKTRIGGEIGLIGDTLFFIAVLIARWQSREPQSL